VVGVSNNQVFTVRDIGISCRRGMRRMSFGLTRKSFLFEVEMKMGENVARTAYFSAMPIGF
jgi:hypothetical protein